MISHLPLRIAASLVTMVAVLHPHLAHCQPAATVASAPVQMEHISVTAVGKGKPIVLIPGLASPRAVWDGVVTALSRDHHVYLVQVNGFADEDPRANVNPGVLAGVVSDLDAFMTREKITGAPVVGHSMGGLVALMLAKTHPADASKLMIVDSLPFIGLLFSPAATVPMVEPQAKAMRDQIAASYGKPANPAAAEATANRLALEPDSRAKVKAWALASDPRVTAEAMYEDMTTDVRADLPAIAAPITLVYPVAADGSDKAATEATYKAAYTGAPKLTMVPVADSAHFVMLDQPAAFETALLAFAK